MRTPAGAIQLRAAGTDPGVADLTRSREVITHERTRKIARLEKQLEDAGIKLSSVASNLSGVSCHDMLTAMVAGQRDPIALSELARGSMRNKRPDLQRALTGRFTEHHAFLVRMSLERIAQDDAAIAALTQRIEAQIEPFRSFRDLICAIPGISTTVADVIIAETGADMSVFPTAGHLAAWAGVAPGQNESAGRTGSTTARPGDSHLKGALGIAAMSVSRTRNTRLGARYHRIAARRGKLKAIVAIERTLLSIVWAMGHTGRCCPVGDQPTATAASSLASSVCLMPSRPITRRVATRIIPAANQNAWVDPKVCACSAAWCVASAIWPLLGGLPDAVALAIAAWPAAASSVPFWVA
ncbi:hypothetical protein FHU39_000762 [Flexivirga oryzae]|uniref:Transposase IS116/IS110/IS902 C-terminal domain-containing protein n=1 Tax=Flexivirga oryzae TaxID=1794944 RepID=A0A839MZD5_9MICO|nr:hypothetical protein [Flexivirga oryzae]